jgi:hypothetical protein
MRAPDRLTVPTCIGCGAMGQTGTCDTGCSERKLELVRVAAYDQVRAAATSARARVDAFASLAKDLAAREPADDDAETTYRSVQTAARAALRTNPGPGTEVGDWQQPAEPAITWWCSECGGIDAPQPCLGICIWRPVEWVNRRVYEQQHERALSECEREHLLRELLLRVAWVPPHADQWERSWRVAQREARRAIAAVTHAARSPQP